MAKHGNKRAVRAIVKIPQFIATQIEWLPICLITLAPYNARSHPEAQISALVRSIETFGWTFPIIIDEKCMILCGHARLEAARRMGMTHVPVIRRAGLSALQKRALAIADNRVSELGEWNAEVLTDNIKILLAADFNVEVTGFVTADIDVLIDGANKAPGLEAADTIDPRLFTKTKVSRLGDVWILGKHTLLCGDARDHASYERLLRDEKAQMIVTDPPYNVKIWGHARGRGKVNHREFAMASGEMSPVQFRNFLAHIISRVIAVSCDSSIHYWFMDWRHLPVLLAAAHPLYSEWKQLLVWNKNNGGQGSFYRSKHELIGVFKNGGAPHINNFGLGEKGRNRTNVLDYPGIGGADRKKRKEMDLHPTVKPIALIADLIRDCSKRNGIVLDPFVGSGTVFLAGERAGRRAFGIEIDPIYVDVAIERWQQLTGQHAIHSDTGDSFAQTRLARASRPNTSALPASVSG